MPALPAALRSSRTRGGAGGAVQPAPRLWRGRPLRRVHELSGDGFFVGYGAGQPEPRRSAPPDGTRRGGRLPRQAGHRLRHHRGTGGPRPSGHRGDEGALAPPRPRLLHQSRHARGAAPRGGRRRARDASRLRPATMSLLDKSEFVGLERVTHLATGGEAPWLRSHDQVTARMGAFKSGGMGGREQLFAVYDRAKSRVARMLGVEAARIAFLGHSSEGLNQAVRAVPWRVGDNVVFADLEYPSSIYPAAILQERGVEARVLRTRDHYLSLDELARLVDRRTRLVLVSQVSYLTGQRVDLARCAEIARGAAPGSLWTPPTPWARCPSPESSAISWSRAAISGCSPRTGWASSPTIRHEWVTSSRQPSAGTVCSTGAGSTIRSRCPFVPTPPGSRRGTRTSSVSSCSTTCSRSPANCAKGSSSGAIR